MNRPRPKMQLFGAYSHVRPHLDISSKLALYQPPSPFESPSQVWVRWPKAGVGTLCGRLSELWGECVRVHVYIYIYIYMHVYIIYVYIYTSYVLTYVYAMIK